MVPVPVPVLLVVFNRPDVTRQNIDALRAVAPQQVFVAADGPRTDHPTDVERCAAVLDEIARIDWPCQVEVLRHERNLGLQEAMVTAISWFFEHVEAGIVLEDDCVVHPDFFLLAADVLERYADRPEVMYVTALNMAPGDGGEPGPSWCFASAGHIWGWATWRRAWHGYDSQLSDWPEHRLDFERDPSPLRRAIGRKADAAHRGEKHTWARAWHYHVAKRRGLVVVPAANLVRNVGLGPEATHTLSTRHSLGGLQPSGLSLPLSPPAEVRPDPTYDAHLTRYHTWSWKRRARERAKAVWRRFSRRARTRDPR